VLAQIADGLGAIHEIGIVHRDLKPANVLVSEEAGSLRVKISDFGVSTIAHGASEAPSEEIEPTTLAEPSERRQSASFDSSDTADHATTSKAPPPHARPETSPIQASPLTETGALLGTPIYMAPELAFGAKNARPSGDIFSLGVIAHEVLTGIRPWMESPAFARQRGESVPPAASLQHIARGLDPAIADVLDACLNREPSARPTAREVSLAIRAHLSHVSTHARVGA
jgi:serine/threonine protein kinase